MKPISAEDTYWRVCMRTNPGKVLGIVVLFIATLLAMYGTLLSTNFSVLDTDPASYVIVVMLMLLVFILFSMKEELHLARSRRELAYGIGVFVLYILLLSYARVGLSFVFATFRIDALLIPLALVSFILILFGASGIRKMAPVVIYALFMSPLLLMPLLLQSQVFANVNAAFVYGALKQFGVPVTLHGITITSSANASISIASTCAPIGTFVALVMFLIPVAYLYRGGLGRKTVWLASGLALMLLLNFARMLWIAYNWANYGIGEAVAVFHLFAGQIMFYAVIIVMILLATRYGMRLDRIEKGKLRALSRDFKAKRSRFGSSWALPLALGAVGLLFSLPYLSAAYASPSFFYGNMSAISANDLYGAVSPAFASFSPNVIRISEQNYTVALAILNGSSSNNATYVVATVLNRPLPGASVTGYSKVVSSSSYLTRKGIRITSVIGYSGGELFDANYFAVPVDMFGHIFSVNYEFIKLASSGASCDLVGYSSAGLFNYIESVIYNTLSGSFGHGANGIMCSAYVVANRA